MNGFDNDYNALVLHKAREQELIAQADNARVAKSLREKVSRHVRRVIRINNNPVR